MRNLAGAIAALFLFLPIVGFADKLNEDDSRLPASEALSRLPAEAAQIQATIETLNSAPFRPQDSHPAPVERNENLSKERARREQIVRDALGGGSLDQSSTADQNGSAAKGAAKSDTQK